MVGYMEPPPVVSDVELANLTYEQLAALINEGNPNDFYLEASAFDEASGRLRQLLDDFLRESRQLQTFVNGELLTAIEEVTQRHAGRINSVLEPMLHPGYAQGLRHAGDALATGQQRLRDMQMQNAQQDPAVPPPPEQPEQQRQQAVRILLDISTAYRDIGGTFGPLPDTVNNGNVNNANNLNLNNGTNNGNELGGDPDGTNGHGPGGNPVFVAGRYRQDPTFSPTHDNSAGGAEPPAAKSTGPEVFVSGGAPGVFAGAQVAGGAAVSALGRPVGGFGGNVLSEATSEPQVEPCQTESVEAAPVVLSAGVLASGVLGRPGARVNVAGASRKEASRKESTTEAEEQEVLAALKEGERPETISAAVPAARDAPAVAAVPTVSAAVPAIPAVPAMPATASAGSAHGASVSIPAFDVRADFGETTAEPVDPKERGMHVPASAGAGLGGGLSTELSSAQSGVYPMIGPGSLAPPASASPAAGTAASGQGMGPMMPPMMMGGMGGMRGGGGEDSSRFADVPVTPDAEVWDPLRATGAVLGRPEQTPEPSEPSEPCSEQDVDAARQAAIQEILGKTGGKRS